MRNISPSIFRGPRLAKIAAGAAAAATLMLLPGATGAFGASNTNKAPKPTATFDDTVTDVTKDTITIQTGRNAGMKVSNIDIEGDVTAGTKSNVKKLKVNSFTKIVVDDLPGTLADVKKGMTVKFEAGMSPDVADSIDAHTIPPALPKAAAKKGAKTGADKTKPLAKPAFQKIGEDIVIAVTPTRITVGERGTKMARAYFITATTAVTVNGAQATASALKTGMDVEVRGDSTTAEAIVAVAGKD